MTYNDFTYYRARNLDVLMYKHPETIQQLYDCDPQKAVQSMENLELSDFPTITDRGLDIYKMHALRSRAVDPDDKTLSKIMQDALVRCGTTTDDVQSLGVAEFMHMIDTGDLTMKQRKWIHEFYEKRKFKYAGILMDLYGKKDLINQPAVQKAIAKLRKKAVLAICPDCPDDELQEMSSKLGRMISKILARKNEVYTDLEIHADPILGTLLFFEDKWNLYCGNHLPDDEAEQAVDDVFYAFVWSWLLHQVEEHLDTEEVTDEELLDQIDFMDSIKEEKDKPVQHYANINSINRGVREADGQYVASLACMAVAVAYLKTAVIPIELQWMQERLEEEQRGNIRLTYAQEQQIQLENQKLRSQIKEQEQEIRSLQNRLDGKSNVAFTVIPKEQNKALQEKDHQIADLRRKIRLLEEELKESSGNTDDEEIMSDTEDNTAEVELSPDERSRLLQEKFAFLCLDETILGRLLDRFPNSTDASTYPFEKKASQQLTAVVVITSRVKHSVTNRVKAECIKKSIPYFSCNTINVDRITEEIAVQMRQLQKNEEAC